MSKILVHGRWLVTEDEKGNQVILEDAFLVIEKDIITYVGKERPLDCDYDDVIDRPNSFVLPGLIDIHYHSDSPMTKGFCEDAGSVKLYGSILYEYLTAIYAAMDEEDWEAIARLTFAEMIRNGITTCVEFNSYFPEQIVELIGEMGLRGYVAPETNSLEGYPYTPDGSTVVIEHKSGTDMLKKLDRNIQLIQKYNGAYNDRVRFTLGPTEPPACRPELLREIAIVREELKVPITMHAAETMIEREYMLREYGVESIVLLKECGIIGPDVILAHTVFASDREKQILAETNTNVAHCPTVFATRGNYMRSLQSYTDLGINVAIGTDTFPQDMIREMHLAWIMSKVADSDFRSSPADLIIRCASQNAARALGRADLGRLVVGAKADITIVSLDSLHTIPVRDPAKVLISCATGTDVTDTIVDGRFLLRNGNFEIFSGEKIKSDAWEAAEKVWSRVPNLKELSPLSIPYR